MCRRRKSGLDEEDLWESAQPAASPRREPEKLEDLGIRLRADMLPRRHASPHFRAYPRPIFTRRRVITFFILLICGAAIWYFGFGPGKPGLEKALVALVKLAATPTATLTPTPTALPPTATETPRPTATRRPPASATPTQSAPPATALPTETQESDCRDYSTVTLEDVGQEMCVQGTVIRVIENQDNTLIVFSDQPGALYLVTYDVDWPEGTIGTCYQVSGEIEYLLNNPVVIFGYSDMPTECP